MSGRRLAALAAIAACVAGAAGGGVTTAAVAHPDPGGTGQAAQTIIFGPLADKTFGDPDFAVAATASSGLPVSFAAAGDCTISGVTVHITGVGSCTITASQAGNASFLPAPEVGQTFSIGKVRQTISFPALPDRKLGDPDFTVTATASSGLPVTFAARGSCMISGSRAHLIAAGTCWITASQPGNAIYDAAASVTRSFSTVRTVHSVRCTVPRVIGLQLAAAKTALTKAQCRTGEIRRVYSRARRKGIVIGQSRRPGQLLPASSKVGLAVSRGPRR